MEKEIKESNRQPTSFNDEGDRLKHVADIKLKIKDDITSDFVLAKLGTKDKEFIIEMTANAYFSKKLIQTLSEKATKWEWDKDKEIYVEVKISEIERKQLEKIGNDIFDGFMKKIFMTVILNRNIDQNYIINVLSGYKDDKTEETNLKDKELKENVANLLADNKNKEK